jgi:hypothetical protein
MQTNEQALCTSCTQKQASDTRYVSCAAVSTYSKAAVATPGNVSVGKWVRFYDAIDIWKISLCKWCLVEGALHFFENKKRTQATALKWSVLVTIIGGVGSLLWNHFIGSTKDTFFMVLGAAFVLALVCGLPFTLYVLSNYVKMSRNIKKVRDEGIDSTSINNSFMGAGDKILRKLESGMKNSLWDDFHLPEFSKEILKNPDNSPGLSTARQIIGGHDPAWTLKRSREIISAGNSVEEVTPKVLVQQGAGC